MARFFVHGDIAKLFQSALADALTHTGRGENYYLAQIAPGRVGLDPPIRLTRYQ
ncbi:MAG: hypothetical protein LAP38_09585 [Acidobacteriia bacterium]|nr:hypothetical protein [Terriglobia bacterium]